MRKERKMSDKSKLFSRPERPDDNISEQLISLIKENLGASLRVVILMILVIGLAYPLLLVLIGDIALPFQSNGSLLTFEGKVIGSKLIAQEFKSDMFFHSRPAANSTSMVDPHITPGDAYAQIHNISKATGLPENALRTTVQLNIERNRVSNALAFAPEYVNVLEVNLDLIAGYQDVYHEFIQRIKTNSSGVS
jgi:K+-transporting ATPase ATPase C chain